jgi:hypothetical protein
MQLKVENLMVDGRESEGRYNICTDVLFVPLRGMGLSL